MLFTDIHPLQIVATKECNLLENSLFHLLFLDSSIANVSLVANKIKVKFATTNHGAEAMEKLTLHCMSFFEGGKKIA